MSGPRPGEASALKIRPKPGSYYGQGRPEMVAELPRPLGRVLDLGCGAGATGPLFRAAGATELIGIEIEADQAERAREVYDTVVVGDALTSLQSAAISGPFDTIAAYDVLEHLVDPAAVLRAARDLAAPGGRLHVSCPNARHATLLRDLIVRGTFGYTEWGHRDATHLRWFTRGDLVAAVQAAGWQVTGTAPSLPGRSATVDRLSRGRLREFIALQWHVLAVIDGPAGAMPPGAASD